VAGFTEWIRTIYTTHKKLITAIIIMALVSPLFGVIGAELVGYHEPLDVAAEMLHLHEAKLPNWTPFADYTVPGLPDTIGYIISAFIGVGVILVIGWLLARAGGR